LTRRRVLREIAAHLDDIVAELEAGGRCEDAAIDEALGRLGDVGTITGAFREVRAERRGWSRARSLRSPAWIAVGAMTLVTAWAADLPQASGAKPTTRALSSAHARPLARPHRSDHADPQDRLLSVRARHPGRP
jgi:hypothetical protein